MKPLPGTYKKEKTDELTSRQESSFLNKNAISPMLLEPGEKIWRMVSRQYGRRFSDFWMDQDTMKHLMSIFTSWGSFSEDVKKAVIRDNIAILDDWKSNLSWRCQITLKQAVIGYSGQTGPQKVFAENKEASTLTAHPVEKIKEFRIGGLNQIVIPRFAILNDSELEKWGEVSHFSRL